MTGGSVARHVVYNRCGSAVIRKAANFVGERESSYGFSLYEGAALLPEDNEAPAFDEPLVTC